MKQTLPVRIAALPSYRVACMRYTGPYGPSGIPRVWERLRKWQVARNVTAGTVSLGIAYDNPSIAAAATCRYDACVLVPMDFEADHRVQVTDTASGRYAVCKFMALVRKCRCLRSHVRRLVRTAVLNRRQTVHRAVSRASDRIRERADRVELCCQCGRCKGYDECAFNC